MHSIGMDGSLGEVIKTRSLGVELNQSIVSSIVEVFLMVCIKAPLPLDKYYDQFRFGCQAVPYL